MQEFMVDWMSDYGGWAIGGLIFLENLFPPIPSELILTFGGFLTVRTELTVVKQNRGQRWNLQGHPFIG